MSTAVWVFLLLITGGVCLVVGVIYGAGKVDQYFGRAAQEASDQIADLSKENTQLRTDLTRWQNERMSL